MRSWELVPGKLEKMALEATPSCQLFYSFLAYVNQLKFFIPCKSYNLIITNNVLLKRMAGQKEYG
jgi:hypothetical protein